MNSFPSNSRVAVLGGGLTGLTTAWHLRQVGLLPVVFEKSPRLGGVIGATRNDGWLHEHGPNSMLESSPAISAFIAAIGLGSRRIYAAPEARQRYILRGGRLVAVPASPWGFVTSPLFSWHAKLALLGEPWRLRASADAEESVADFVVRRLGREFLDYAINPFVGGVYAGDPTKLSVRHAFPKLHALEQEYGSLIRGALKRRNASGGPKGRMFSFPNGLAEVPAALARALGDAVRLRTEVKTVRRTEGGWELEYEDTNGCHAQPFAAVVCALPADALASLTIEGVGEACDLTQLREIDHPPIASVFTGYRREDVRHPLDGFGALMPEVERTSILGTLFSSTLFPGRAPQGHVALTTFVGGMRQPKLATLDDDALLRVVQKELSGLIGVTAPAVFTRVQRWPRAIPQYATGYERFKNIMADIEACASGLFIGGNARDGISLANCLESGRRLAGNAERFLVTNRENLEQCGATGHDRPQL
jgi:oxygen-dependent protoporphyrinogen oxidase